LRLVVRPAQLLVTITLAGICVFALMMGSGRWAEQRSGGPATAADARQAIRVAALNDAANAIRDGEAAFLARIELDGSRRIPGLGTDEYDRCFVGVAGTVSISNDPRLYAEDDPRRYELYFEVFNAAIRRYLGGETGCPAAQP
jgi:hypothetical protein